jgi:hypothetical protein
MKPKDAIKFCETHECKECPIYIYDIEKRSRIEKEDLHVMCCENLMTHPDWLKKEDEE